MREKHLTFLNSVLLDGFLVSSSMQEGVVSSRPSFLREDNALMIRECVESVDALLRRHLPLLLRDDRLFHTYFDPFPLRQKIRAISSDFAPFFWARYDLFITGTGVKVLEANYDKPCGQRESLYSSSAGIPGDINKEFRNTFITALKEKASAYFGSAGNRRICFLADPAHYEETHLSYLYASLVNDEGFDPVIAGPDNLTIENGKLTAFKSPVDILVRQYPAEYFHEIEQASSILDIHEKGGLLLLNDLRAVFAQSKSVFAWCWDEAAREQSVLSPEERSVVRRCIPYTRLLTSEIIPEILHDRDHWVLKPALGRYSEDVYIGALLTDEEWEMFLSEAAASDRIFILQEYCDPVTEQIPRFDGRGYLDTSAKGNYGAHLMNGSFSGIAMRWSESVLTREDSVWSTPVKLCRPGISVAHLNLADDKLRSLADDVFISASFPSFSGLYTGSAADFTTDCASITPKQYCEIKSLCEQGIGILHKTAEFVSENISLFTEPLGLVPELIPFLKSSSAPDSLTRFDLCYDTDGRIRVLEFNADTPGGLFEALVLQPALHANHAGFADPNAGMKETLAALFKRKIEGSGAKLPCTVGFLSMGNSEDWCCIHALADAVAQESVIPVFGDFEALEAKDDALYIYGTKLDMVYRYYPSEWISDHEILRLLGGKVPSINPLSSHILQGKGLFALMKELIGKKFYSEQEERWIREYLPESSLSAGTFRRKTFCAKPFYQREGQGVRFSFSPDFAPADDDIYQEEIQITPVETDVMKQDAVRRKSLFPVIGAYMSGNSLCGFYTRLGGRVTGHDSVFIPLFIQEQHDAD